MARTGENIYKRKDGRWEGRFIRCYDGSGKAKYTSIYAKTYREVKIKLLQAQTRLPAQQPKTQAACQSYGAWLQDWLQFQHARVKESTYVRYTNLISHHIAPQLGRYPVNKLSTELLEQYLSGLLLHGRLDGTGGLAPKTVSDILAIVKSTFRYAAAHGMELSCDLHRLNPQPKPKEMRTLTLAEEARLMKTLQEKPDQTKAGVLLALYTGIRIGELCALRWEDISLKEKTIHIHATLQRLQQVPAVGGSKTKLTQTTPKSICANRVIPLPGFVVKTLRSLKAAPQAYFLTGTTKCMEPRTMQNRFKAYLRQSGIENVNFHALGHTFATRCVESGFDIKSLSEILGHSSVKITLDKYVHSSMQLKRANMALLVPAKL